MNTENGGLAACLREGHVLSLRAIKQMRDALDRQASNRRDHKEMFENRAKKLVESAGEYVSAMRTRRYEKQNLVDCVKEFESSTKKSAAERRKVLAGAGIETEKDGGLSFPGFG